MKNILQQFLVISLLAISSTTLLAQQIPNDSLYLGQTPPGNTPVLFNLPISPGLRTIERIAITSEGTEIYYGELDIYPPTTQRIQCIRYQNNKWQAPVVVFEGFMGPALSIDENMIFMQKNVDGIPTAYYSIRKDNGWTEPVKLFSRNYDIHYYQMTNSGNTYASVLASNSNTNRDFCKLITLNSDTVFENLGTPVNSAVNENDFFVDKDESYIIFSRHGGGIAGEMYITFKTDTGKWTNPKKLGAQINTPNWEYGQFITHDKKYMFFTRGGNDMSTYNTYWVKIDNIIDSLRQSNFTPYINRATSSQKAFAGKLFTLQIAEDAFTDDDNNTLTYTAALSTGDALPEWLTFDSSTRTLSGKPEKHSCLRIKVTATDIEGAGISSDFTLTVLNADGSGAASLNSGLPYFGQNLPGETPELFAPEILNSLSPWVEATEFSPDGSQFFLAVGNADYSGAKLYYSKFENNAWTPFAEAPFISDFIYSNEPVFSKDGSTLTFTGKKTTGSLDLWTVEYKDQKWGTPVALPSAINSEGLEYRTSYMTDGTMYFTRISPGKMAICKGYKNEDGELIVEAVHSTINTDTYEGDPCIAPDGHFLIFNSGREGGVGGADLYVSFSDGEGYWETPINLGNKFNSPNHEYGAHLTADGKYLFFTSHSTEENLIYWVEVSAIEKLR